MEVSGYTIDGASCSRSILLASESQIKKKDKYMREYLSWGEEEGVDQNPTCKGRATFTSKWFDLTRYNRPSLILPKIQQYRLQTFLNPDLLYQNSSLLGIYDVDVIDQHFVAGVLNSTWAIFSRLNYARLLGNEGNIQLDVYSAKMMLVPNFQNCNSKPIRTRIEKAFSKMLKRDALAFLSERQLRAMALKKAGKEREIDLLPSISELDMKDRRDLDDAVLALLGISKKAERAVLLDNLYDLLKDFFADVRAKEEVAIVNKNKSKRKSKVSPADIASEVISELQSRYKRLLKPFRSFVDDTMPFDTFDLPETGSPQVVDDIFAEHGAKKFVKGRRQIAAIEAKSAGQAALLAMIAESGLRGLVRIPREEGEVRRVQQQYRKLLEERQGKVEELIEERVSDADLQIKVAGRVRTAVFR